MNNVHFPANEASSNKFEKFANEPSFIGRILLNKKVSNNLTKMNWINQKRARDWILYRWMKRATGVYINKLLCTHFECPEYQWQLMLSLVNRKWKILCVVKLCSEYQKQYSETSVLSEGTIQLNIDPVSHNSCMFQQHDTQADMKPTVNRALLFNRLHRTVFN